MGLKMTTDELIQAVYRKTSGELDTSITALTEDGKTILSIINEQVDVYFNSIDRFGARIIWSRNVDPSYVIGDADGVEVEFEINWKEVQALSDGFYTLIKVGDVPYSLVPFDQLYLSSNQDTKRCSITSNGLLFYEAPLEGEIIFPCVIGGKRLVGGETDVEKVTGVHNLLWLTFASAAEYIRTDIVRGDQYPNVLAQANDIFSRMITDNTARTQPAGYGYSQVVQGTWGD
jgi:hypothetical protein